MSNVDILVLPVGFRNLTTAKCCNFPALPRNVGLKEQDDYISAEIDHVSSHARSHWNMTALGGLRHGRTKK